MAAPIVNSEPLKPWMRYGLLAVVIFFHVGGGWALTRIHPAPIVVGEVAPMEVSFVTEQPPQLQPDPKPPTLEPPSLPDLAQPEPPKPELAAQLESMVAPPEPDLPPPTFAVPPPPKPVAKPKPPPPHPHPHPRPRQAQPKPPPAHAPAASAPAAAAPRTVDAAQVGYLTKPAPVYPVRARRDGEQGTVLVRALVDASGRPAEVVLEKSSGHLALDQSAVSAVRAARFRPYIEGGVAQAVWVVCPIRFALQ